jgi:protein CMS1
MRAVSRTLPKFLESTSGSQINLSIFPTEHRISPDIPAAIMAIEDDSQEPLLEHLSASPGPENPRTVSKKRKRGVELERAPKKAAKKAKSKKQKAVEEDELDIDAGINNAFSHMNCQLLADYVAQRTRKYENDLSLVELEDKYIPGMFSHCIGICLLTIFTATAIQDTTSWNMPRTIENLPSFLEQFSGNSAKLWSASKKNGAPHTIIVAAAGLRAADIARYTNLSSSRCRF